ncbi:MAG: ABC transporter transmembrane domain-containing protein [Ilumatobacteraceae bacterium]|nr:ABC transporter transmembrane domain-containing protein [Ilumatobacteraceae bacterium]
MSDKPVKGVTKEGWKLLRETLIPQRNGLLAGVAIGLSWSVGKMAVPQLTRYAIDRGISKNGSLLFWTSTILAAALVAGVFAGWRRFIAFRESRLTETVLRERLFAQIQGLHVGFHDRTQTGQLMSRASSDLLQVQGFVLYFLFFSSLL